MANKNIFLNSGAHKADLPKGTFDKSFRNHLTAKLGYLYPCLVEEAVAGSTYNIRPDMVFDMMPTAMPLQSRMRAHVSIFNVPFRIVMKNYKDYFSRVGDHAMPYISRSDDWVKPGSLADYMGVPTAQFSTAQAPFTGKFLERGRLNLDRPEFTYYINQHQGSLDPSIPASHFFDTSSSNVAVISQPLESGFADSNFNFHTFSSVQTLGNNLFVYLVFHRRTGDGSRYYCPLKLHGAGDNGIFTSSSAATQPAGTFKYIGRSQVYSNPNSSVAYYDTEFNIKFTDDDVSDINNFLNETDSVFRIMLVAQSLTSSLGTSSGIVPTVEEVLQFIGYVSTFEKDESNYAPIVSLISYKTILSPFSYNALVGDLESSRKYFNVVDGNPPALPINALAFRAYEFIYNKYFRNLQVDKFYKNGEPSYNEYITNDGDGADSTTPVDLKRVPYEYDVFTTALPSPQMGYAPLVGVTTNDATGIGLLHMIPLVDGEPDPSQAYDIGVAYNSENGDITGISNYDEVANKTSVSRLREAIDFGISINDLRNVSAFQRLKEKMMKAGYEYQPLMEEFYGTTPPIGEEFPEYLGGFTREIQIGKIQNTALTAEHPLGEFAGVGGVAGSSRTIRVYTKEPSYIIGVLWFSVTPTYSQMLPKHFLKFHPLDYFNPTFNAIGPQPIHTHEIAPLQLAPENLDQVFGYQRPWYDYVSRVDECHGEFRTSMRHYLMQRLFAVAPELTANFINIHSEELTDIFTYTVDSDKFFGYIDFDIKCKSPVARVSVPRIIG